MPCRYNGGLLEFHKSLQEIGDTNDHWFDIEPMEDEDLPTTFKVSNYLRITFYFCLIRIIFDKVQVILTMSYSIPSTFFNWKLVFYIRNNLDFIT